MAVDVPSLLEKSSYRWRRNTMDFPHYNQGKLARTGGGGRGESTQSNGEVMLSAAVAGCLKTSCPSTDLTLSGAISFYTASSPRGFAPWGVGGKSRECLHCCHQRSSLMEEDMKRCECSKGSSSWNGPTPEKTLSSPVMLSASLPVPPASEPPCTCQHAVELLTMGHFFTALFVFKQLEKLKDQLSTEEGSEVAYALESLSASQPKKRGRFWVRPLQPFHPALISMASFLQQRQWQ